MNKCLATLGLTVLASLAWGQNLFSNQSTNPNVVALHSSTQALDGSPAPVSGFYSELQSNGAPNPFTVLNSTSGFSVYNDGTPGGSRRLADDFTVTNAGWRISGIKVYGYAVGVQDPWLTGGSMRIWRGRPGDQGASQVWNSGNLIARQIDQNGLITTNAGFGNLYRIPNTSPDSGSANTTRRVLEFTFSVPNITLQAGTYWIDYQLLRGTDEVFSPSTTHSGVRGVASANARRFNGAAWENLVDPGSLPPNPNNLGNPINVAQEVPFIVTGEPVPEPMTMTVLALGAVAALRRKRKA